jgi:hypothetical protein
MAVVPERPGLVAGREGVKERVVRRDGALAHEGRATRTVRYIWESTADHCVPVGPGIVFLEESFCATESRR